MEGDLVTAVATVVADDDAVFAQERGRLHELFSYLEQEGKRRRKASAAEGVPPDSPRHSPTLPAYPQTLTPPRSPTPPPPPSRLPGLYAPSPMRRNIFTDLFFDSAPLLPINRDYRLSPLNSHTCAIPPPTVSLSSLKTAFWPPSTPPPHEW